MTKLLILSDSHNSSGAVERILHAESDANAVVFLGDATANRSSCPMKPNFASCSSAKHTVSCEACSGSPKPAVWMPKCSTLR